LEVQGSASDQEDLGIKGVDGNSTLKITPHHFLASLAPVLSSKQTNAVG